MALELPLIPESRPEDVEDVSWGLQTAAALWNRGDKAEAVVWIKRAAEAARHAGQDARAVELGKSALEVDHLLNGPSSRALEPQRPPLPPPAPIEDLETIEPEAADELFEEETHELTRNEVPKPASAAASTNPTAQLAPPAAAPPAAATAPAAPTTTSASSAAVAAVAPAPPPSVAPASIQPQTPATVSYPAVAISSVPEAGESNTISSVPAPGGKGQSKKPQRAPILDPWSDELPPSDPPPRTQHMRPDLPSDDDDVMTSAPLLDITLKRKPPPPVPKARSATLTGGTVLAASDSTDVLRIKPDSPAPPGVESGARPPPPPTRKPTVPSFAAVTPPTDGAPRSERKSVPPPPPPRVAFPSSYAPEGPSTSAAAPESPATAGQEAAAAEASPAIPLDQTQPLPAGSQLEAAMPFEQRNEPPPPTMPAAQVAQRASRPDLQELTAPPDPPPARPPQAPARAPSVPPPPPRPPTAPPPRPRSSPPEPPHKSEPPPAPTRTSTVPPAARSIGSIRLDQIELFADLSGETHKQLVASAGISALGLEEEVAVSGAALVLEGSAAVCATIADAAAAQVGPGALVPGLGSLPEPTRIRVVATGPCSIASWDRNALEEILKSSPWVIEELQKSGDRFAALAGATMGALGDLDEGSRLAAFDRLTLRVLAAGEVLVPAGGELSGLTIVGAGSMLVDRSTPAEFGAGDVLLPETALEGGTTDAAIKAGPGGALLLSASRMVTVELFSTIPSLLELLR